MSLRGMKRRSNLMNFSGRTAYSGFIPESSKLLTNFVDSNCFNRFNLNLGFNLNLRVCSRMTDDEILDMIYMIDRDSPKEGES